MTESTVNLFKAACGPGALSLAFACSHAGLGLAPFVLVCLQCCCVYNMFLLIWLCLIQMTGVHLWWRAVGMNQRHRRRARNRLEEER